MKNLILKDLKLSVHPTTAIYAAVAGGLMFVPAYPRSMAFLYSIIGIFMIFQCDLQNHDRTFCCLLPVTKKQIVKSRVLSVILIQLGLMLISVPCAVAARTILKNAPIIILDEATASVDLENERHIQNAIAALTKEKTVLLIAHRLSTVVAADQILVVRGGAVREHGTHEELLRLNGAYSALWRAQYPETDGPVSPAAASIVS